MVILVGKDLNIKSWSSNMWLIYNWPQLQLSLLINTYILNFWLIYVIILNVTHFSNVFVFIAFYTITFIDRYCFSLYSNVIHWWLFFLLMNIRIV